MPLSATYKKYTLDFKFEAGTSRGVLKQKDSWFIFIQDSANQNQIGIGECAPLKGLSPDDVPHFGKKMEEVCLKFKALELKNISIDEVLIQFELQQYPSILFGIETAYLDLLQGGKRILFPSDFTNEGSGIPINGLVWMGDENFMTDQLHQKINEGYACIKLKIGAIDFEKEIKLIKTIRSTFSKEQMSIRVDANGAFTHKEAIEKLTILKAYNIHSVEQPIKAGQEEAMADLCRRNIIPIALDEELIGVKTLEQKRELLEKINPQYIILKPTLVGGLSMCREWISCAESMHIGYWITSALESNIGLNAISQFTATLNSPLPQGLGTGQLFHNNIESPLIIKKGHLHFDPNKHWEFPKF